MIGNPPKLITITNDEYEAKFIGKTQDNRQFFLTTPFVPKSDRTDGREFIALYLFDFQGNFLEAKIDDLGIREEMDDDYRISLFQSRLDELGEISFQPIIIAPFRLEKFGTEFGFIVHKPEEMDEDWWVTVEPGDYMAFYSPWDSGDYDT